MIVAFSNRINVENEHFEVRDALAHDWSSFASRMGFIPISIPNAFERTDEFLSKTNVQAIFLTGGGECPLDINDLDKENKLRNITEYKCIEYALKNNIPLIGVCRGFQFINIYFKGRVTKNFGKIIDGKINHVNKEITISYTEHSKLSGVSSGQYKVLCFNDDGILQQDLAEDLDCIATSENERVVESFFHKHFRILGIQWHPEREGELSEFNRNIINAFLREKEK